MMTATARILIVDPDPADAAPPRALIAAGYEVECLQDGAAALARLEQKRIDLAVVSTNLTGAVRAVRVAYAAYKRDIPSLLIGAAPDAADRLKHLFWPHLCKPLSDAALIDTVTRVLAEHYGKAPARP